MDDAALTSLDDLVAPRNIGGAVLGTCNPVLASLDGLAALQSVELAYGTVDGRPSGFISDDAARSPGAIAALRARLRHNRARARGERGDAAERHAPGLSPITALSAHRVFDPAPVTVLIARDRH